MTQSNKEKGARSTAAIAGNPWLSSTLIPGSLIAEQQSTFLAILHASLRQSVPPAPMIRALAKEYPGSYSYKLLRVARMIDQGVPWVDALEQEPGVLPSDTILALRLGQQSGITNATFEQLRLESSEELIDREPSYWRPYLAYWLAVSFTMLSIMSFFSYFIGPTLLKMLQEFDMQRGYDKLSSALRYSTLPAAIALGLTCLGILLTWSEGLRTWFAKLLRIPQDSFSQNQASLLRILANNTEHGRPMEGALSTLSKFHANADMRKRLLIARNEIEKGSQEWDAIGSVGLLTAPQQEALQGQSKKDQAWVLRKLAQSLSTHEHYRWGWLQSILHPIVLIAFGLFVLAVSYAFLESLYSIVSELAQDTRWR
jgi:type II secretory pathway component PulF